MKEPQTWYDKSLLDYEPFLSSFKARQLAAPPTRGTENDNDARNDAVVKDLEEMNLVSLSIPSTFYNQLHRSQLKTVQAWLDLAFKPHWKDAEFRNDIERWHVDVSEPELKRLFVQFYWALFCDYEFAVRILNKERSKRGHGYMLGRVTLRCDTLVSSADSTKQVHPKQIGDDTFRPPFQKVPGSIPHGLKFKKYPKDVPGYPEREGKSSSQTCPPSLDPTSLSETCQFKFYPSTLPLRPDSQNTSDLSKPRKRRQTGPDTPRKKHRRINEATSDASKLGDDNNLIPQSQAWSHSDYKEGILSLSCPPVTCSTSESTRFELLEKVSSLPSNAPVPNIHDPQRGVEAHPAQGKQKSRSLGATKTPVMVPRPKDATLQRKQHGTTSNPKKRRASSSEGHQRKRREVPVDQEDSVPITVQPDLVKRKRGRPPKLKEGQEGSASNMPFASRKKKDRLLESKVLSLSQAQLNAGTLVPYSGENVDMTQETSITSCIPFSPAQSSHAVSGLMLGRGTKEEIIIHSENWWSTQEHGLVEEDFTLDYEAPAATQMEYRPTDIFPTQKPPLCVNPPIWAQVRDNALRYNKLSSTFLSSPAKKFVKPLIGFGAIKVAFILRTM